MFLMIYQMGFYTFFLSNISGGFIRRILSNQALGEGNIPRRHRPRHIHPADEVRGVLHHRNETQDGHLDSMKPFSEGEPGSLGYHENMKYLACGVFFLDSLGWHSAKLTFPSKNYSLHIGISHKEYCIIHLPKLTIYFVKVV